MIFKQKLIWSIFKQKLIWSKTRAQSAKRPGLAFGKDGLGALRQACLCVKRRDSPRFVGPGRSASTKLGLFSEE
jgi:hypothetical protein